MIGKRLRLKNFGRPPSLRPRPRQPGALESLIHYSRAITPPHRLLLLPQTRPRDEETPLRLTGCFLLGGMWRMAWKIESRLFGTS